MARRNYSSTAQSTTLTADITNVATSMVVTAVTGWPASTPYTIVVDEDLSTQEVMLVTARAGTTLTVTRAYGGTTGVSHTAGATVRHAHYSGDFDEANSFLNLGGTIGGAVTVTGAVAGTSGTFSAAVAGTTGTFSGAVSGTTGTFSGVVAHPLGAVGAPSVTFSGDSNTGIYSPSADNLSLATAGVQRLNIDSSGLFSGTGTSLGAWTSFAATLAGTGWAIGNGTITVAYCKIGRTVYYKGGVVFGTTSTYGAATAPIIGLPGIAVNSTLQSNMGGGVTTSSTVGGTAVFVDSSATQGYAVIPVYSNTLGGISFSVLGTNGIMTAATSTVPFTWATGDQINFFVAYESTT